jgi:hypothetical protein
LHRESQERKLKPNAAEKEAIERAAEQEQYGQEEGKKVKQPGFEGCQGECEHSKTCQDRIDPVSGFEVKIIDKVMAFEDQLRPGHSTVEDVSTE